RGQHPAYTGTGHEHSPGARSACPVLVRRGDEQLVQVRTAEGARTGLAGAVDLDGLQLPAADRIEADHAGLTPERDPQVPLGVDRHPVRRTTCEVGDDPHRTPGAVVIDLVGPYCLRTGVDEVDQRPVGGVHQAVGDEQLVEHHVD